jgi:hypothetical protein
VTFVAFPALHAAALDAPTPEHDPLGAVPTLLLGVFVDMAPAAELPAAVPALLTGAGVVTMVPAGA